MSKLNSIDLKELDIHWQQIVS